MCAKTSWMRVTPNELSHRAMKPNDKDNLQAGEVGSSDLVSHHNHTSSSLMICVKVIWGYTRQPQSSYFCMQYNCVSPFSRCSAIGRWHFGQKPFHLPPVRFPRRNLI